MLKRGEGVIVDEYNIVMRERAAETLSQSCKGIILPITNPDILVFVYRSFVMETMFLKIFRDVSENVQNMEYDFGYRTRV